MTDAIEPFYEDEERPEVKGPWRVESVTDLDWAMRRMAQLAAEHRSIWLQAAAESDCIAQRVTKLTAKLQHGIAFFEAKIAEYALGRKDKLLTGQRKSRDMLHGRIGWRQQPGRLTVTDPVALATWLAAQEDETLYRKKIQPEMAALNALHAKDGTVPPGCEYQPAQDEFYTDPITLEEPK